MAGSDTTATAIRMVLYYIIATPKVYAKFQSEIDQAIRIGTMSRPIIQDREARQLPYVQACIKEGLRVFPPVSSLLTKVAPPEGDTLPDGTFIPGETRVGISPWATHRNKATFGEDAHVFRPERWLEATGDQLQRMERTVEILFGWGRYGCLGKSVAFIELNKFFVEVNFPTTALFFVN
jgi:cytochrome P450